MLFGVEDVVFEYRMLFWSRGCCFGVEDAVLE